MEINQRKFEIVKKRIDTLSDYQLKEVKALIDIKLTRDITSKITQEEIDFLLEVFNPTEGA
ncbi:hypothetical protein [Vibrio panuliri]|uniref:Uncharacterized protein n=1 Tax=Vibrio panuliri TaxID=1381081 RepID=A0ABX3FJ69_9VIBR|nr:hypothetical protein [Vibrio panuliri]KAB1457410.1 hypothetical protein F7O85_06620 [Vibrio panuliri]OLQ91429.1 hypothetical protein BIY20_01060 [Vibrio panuliri]